MSSEKVGRKEKSHTTQTDTTSIDQHFTKAHNIGTVSSEVNLVDHDNNDRKSINQSVRSRNSEFISIQSNPMQSPNSHDAKLTPTSSGYNSYHHQQHGETSHDHEEPHHFEDVVETKTFPTVQVPTFSKIKQGQYPTIVNHLESEPYKKILNRSNPNSYSRYHDQSRVHHETPTFYDDFTKLRQESYYQVQI